MASEANHRPYLGKYCDHTVLKPFTKREIVAAFCEEAIKYNAASVCVNPYHVAFVKERLKDTSIHTCTVIGFPLGANTPAVKAFEAADAVKNGADEVDMVINVGALRDGETDLVFQDIKGVVDAVDSKTIVKVIIETCYLTAAEINEASKICMAARAHYVKTSTGFGTRGASAEDLRLIKEAVGDSMKIKASTGILTQAIALTMIEAGADRLGVSTTPQIVTGDDNAVTVSARNKPPEV